MGFDVLHQLLLHKVMQNSASLHQYATPMANRHARICELPTVNAVAPLAQMLLISMT